MKTILVPTDFSENAINACEYAVGIAQKLQARIILLNVFHIPMIVGDVPEGPLMPDFEELKGLSYKKLEEAKAEIDRRYPNVHLNIYSIQGFAVSEITDFAERNNIDLIIMGTQGASGLQELIIGSNTASVIEDAKCPVLAIPKNTLFKGIKNIVYATDYLESDISAINNLSEIAALFDAEIIVTHIAESENETAGLKEWFIEATAKKLKYKKLSFRLITDNNVVHGLHEFTRSMPADILAMTTRRHNLFQKLFNPSITKKMAFHTEIPLLAFHA